MKVEDSYTKKEKQIASILDVTCEIARRLIEIRDKYENGNFR